MKYLYLMLAVALITLGSWGFNALIHLHEPGTVYVTYALGIFFGAVALGDIVHGQKPDR